MEEPIISPNTFFYTFISVFIATKVITAITGVTLLKFLHKSPNSPYRILAISGCFLVVSHLIMVAHVSSNPAFQKIIHSFCVITEVTFMYLVNCKSIKSKKIVQAIKYSLIITTSIYLILSIDIQPSDPRNYFYFTIISLIFITSSLFYFHQLANEISYIEVTKQPETLLQLGVFFCNSLPFITSITWTSIYLADKDLANELATIKYDKPNLFTIAQIAETFYYFIFMYFIIKAFKWRRPNYI